MSIFLCSSQSSGLIINFCLDSQKLWELWVYLGIPFTVLTTSRFRPFSSSSIKIIRLLPFASVTQWKGLHLPSLRLTQCGLKLDYWVVFFCTQLLATLCRSHYLWFQLPRHVSWEVIGRWKLKASCENNWTSPLRTRPLKVLLKRQINMKISNIYLNRQD